MLQRAAMLGRAARAQRMRRREDWRHVGCGALVAARCGAEGALPLVRRADQCSADAAMQHMAVADLAADDTASDAHALIT